MQPDRALRQRRVHTEVLAAVTAKLPLHIKGHGDLARVYGAHICPLQEQRHLRKRFGFQSLRLKVQRKGSAHADAVHPLFPLGNVENTCIHFPRDRYAPGAQVLALQEHAALHGGDFLDVSVRVRHGALRRLLCAPGKARTFPVNNDLSAFKADFHALLLLPLGW